MPTDPLSAALARLYAAYPDLPEDGGRVWEPVQDICQFHSPDGDPCTCGHDAGADCHPKES
jgi:hypothetical protein